MLRHFPRFAGYGATVPASAARRLARKIGGCTLKSLHLEAAKAASDATAVITVAKTIAQNRTYATQGTATRCAPILAVQTAMTSEFDATTQLYPWRAMRGLNNLRTSF
jgi:hypothetical protein